MLEEVEIAIKQIETCIDNDELTELSKTFNITNLLTNKISSKISSNEQHLKSSVLENISSIITLFQNIKLLKEDFKKSKKGLDAFNSQLLM